MCRMVGCSVLSCKSRSERKDVDITFHSFPLDSVLRIKWIKATGRSAWQPTKYSKMCSTHFEDDAIVYKNKTRRLKAGTYPTKYIPNSTECSSSPNVSPSDSESNFELDTEPLDETDKEDGYSSHNQHKNTKVTSASNIIEEKNVQEYQCDICKKVTNACVRYTCVECNNAQLCAACESRGQHTEHYVLRIPAVKSQTEVEEVLKRIRDMITEMTAEMHIPEVVRIKQEEDYLEIHEMCPDLDIGGEDHCAPQINERIEQPNREQFVAGSSDCNKQNEKTEYDQSVPIKMENETEDLLAPEDNNDESNLCSPLLPKDEPDETSAAIASITEEYIENEQTHSSQIHALLRRKIYIDKPMVDSYSPKRIKTQNPQSLYLSISPLDRRESEDVDVPVTETMR